MLQILANWADYRKLNLQKLGQAAGDFKTVGNHQPGNAGIGIQPIQRSRTTIRNIGHSVRLIADCL